MQMMRHCESQRGNLCGFGTQGFDRNIIKFGCSGGGLIQRAAPVLADVAHGAVVPGGNLVFTGDVETALTHRLAQRKCQPGRGVGHVLTEHEHCVALFNFAQADRFRRGGAENFQCQFHQCLLGRGHAGTEIFRTDQPA